MKKNCFIALLGSLLAATGVSGITLEEVAGIYVGKVTRTSFGLVEHMDQVTAIDLSGNAVVYTWTRQRGQPQVLFLEYWRIAPLSQFGTFGDFSTDACEGLVRLRGNHLTMVVLYSDGGTVREMQGRRVDTFPDFVVPWWPY